jgi:hypothetical protein
MALRVSSGRKLLELKKQQPKSALLWALPEKGKEPEHKTVFLSDPPVRLVALLPFDQVVS